MYSLLLAIIYLAFISLGLPDSLLGSAWPVMRLQFGVPLSYPCKKCGAPITQGDLCQKCMTEMRESLQKETAKITAAKQAARDRSGGMHSMQHETRTKRK